MKQAWGLFRHSILQVFGNLGAALRISLLLSLVGVTFHWYIVHAFLPNSPVALQAPSARLRNSEPVWALLLDVLVRNIVAVWIAVAWHRFILKEEQPRGVIPRPRSGRMLAYLWRWIWMFLLLLLLIGIGASVDIVLTFVFAKNEVALHPENAATSNLLAVAIAFGCFVFASALFNRIAALLPAAALGEKLRLREASRVTRGQMWTFVVLSVILAIVFAVLSVSTKLLMILHLPLLAWPWLAVSNWLELMIGVSVLTTIYGHYVERRPLRA